MKIFKENDRIRLQLKDMRKGTMLFDFTIEKEAFKELKNHIIEHLENYEEE